jgi:hypothetical protein
MKASLFLVLSVLSQQSLQLSFMMSRSDPYCFTHPIEKSGTQDVKIMYTSSGLNEEQVQVQVRLKDNDTFAGLQLPGQGH